MLSSPADFLNLEMGKKKKKIPVISQVFQILELSMENYYNENYFDVFLD